MMELNLRMNVGSEKFRFKNELLKFKKAYSNNSFFFDGG
jgi:hypothetical protein